MKLHKQFDQVKPYSYLIYQKSTGKYYYGIRWKNWSKLGKTPEEDFWIIYFSSCKNIKAEIKLKGLDDFVVELRQTFESVDEANAWEKKFLRRVNALERQDLWWNANIGNNKVATPAGRKKISATHLGVPKSETHKQNLSKSQKGKPKKSTAYQGEEYRRRNSERNRGPLNPMYGPCTPERAANISKAKKGKPAKNKGVSMSEDQKALISKTKEKNKILLTCPVCNKTMRKSHYKMYGHGPNCSMKQCPHCKEYHGKTKYDALHGDKCGKNPNRAKPFIARPGRRKAPVKGL